ncbi:peptidylprolyl isomerase [Propionibacteriaceae bacterium G57]|uniref:peptidylprolyl isomerase n=1 Tax=Aestuariimicrobium sp. G57 TaxID=3418485 RepID=UPI003DA6E6E1
MSRLRRPLAVATALVLIASFGACSRLGATEVVPTGPTATCSYPASGGAARPVDLPDEQAPNTGTLTATLEMAAGTVTITMPRENAPCAINSFQSLAEQGFYDDTKCHRLVDSGIFILQCGDPTASGTGGPGYAYADELKGTEKYTRGTVAMANRGKDTNGSQFFIVWSDSSLAADYTVLGTIDEASLVTIGKIASQGVDATNGVSPIADAGIRKVVLG